MAGIQKEREEKKGQKKKKKKKKKKKNIEPQQQPNKDHTRIETMYTPSVYTHVRSLSPRRPRAPQALHTRQWCRNSRFSWSGKQEFGRKKREGRGKLKILASDFWGLCIDNDKIRVRHTASNAKNMFVICIFRCKTHADDFFDF
jgi:hypothetical protein